MIASTTGGHRKPTQVKATIVYTSRGQQGDIHFLVTKCLILGRAKYSLAAGSLNSGLMLDLRPIIVEIEVDAVVLVVALDARFDDRLLAVGDR